jgi:hypothetical protein
MGVRVLELAVKVIVSGNSGLSRDCTGNIADEVVAILDIVSTGWDECRAGESSTVEFIDE